MYEMQCIGLNLIINNIPKIFKYNDGTEYKFIQYILLLIMIYLYELKGFFSFISLSIFVDMTSWYIYFGLIPQ